MIAEQANLLTHREINCCLWFKVLQIKAGYKGVKEPVDQISHGI
jgi:hypothetical protein